MNLADAVKLAKDKRGQRDATLPEIWHASASNETDALLAILEFAERQHTANRCAVKNDGGCHECKIIYQEARAAGIGEG